MRVTDLTMTFYSPERRAIPVRRALAQVFKQDAGWRAFVAIELSPEYRGVDGTPYYREEREGLATRADAIRVCRAWLLDHLSAHELPEGVELLIERGAARPFSADLDPARPFARKDRTA
jgi:hypothetical protein